MGCKRLVRSLKTGDIHLARARRHAVLATFQTAYATAQQKIPDNSDVEIGMANREWLKSLREDEAAARHAHSGRAPDEDEDEDDDETSSPAHEAEGRIIDHLQDLERTIGPARVHMIADISFGRATPLLHWLDAWIIEGGPRGPVRAQTAGQYRSDLARLDAWLKRAKHTPTIEVVTKRVAGQFITEGLQGVHWKTANRIVSAASSYFRWLDKRGHVEANPWQGQSISKRSQDEDDAKREFSDAELLRLFTSDPEPEMRDAMTLAALSGMRLDEIYQLRVADCAGGWFRIRVAKTKSGIRRVPIHAGIAAMVAARSHGRPGEAYLIHEAGPERPKGKRSMPMSKRFGTYRQSVGVHDRTEGQRSSLVDFHSFRRWFITQARHEFDLAVVQAIVGHKPDNITDATYSGGPTAARKVACVASVRLPPGCLVEAPE